MRHCLRHGGIRISSPGGSSLIISPRSQNKSFVYNEACPAVPLQPNRLHAKYKNPEGVPNASPFPPSYQWLNRAQRTVVPLHTYLQQSLRFHRPRICLNLMRHFKSFFATSDKMSTAKLLQVLLRGLKQLVLYECHVCAVFFDMFVKALSRKTKEKTMDKDGERRDR